MKGIFLSLNTPSDVSVEYPVLGLNTPLKFLYLFDFVSLNCNTNLGLIFVLKTIHCGLVFIPFFMLSFTIFCGSFCDFLSLSGINTLLSTYLMLIRFRPPIMNAVGTFNCIKIALLWTNNKRKILLVHFKNWCNI